MAKNKPAKRQKMLVLFKDKPNLGYFLDEYGYVTGIYVNLTNKPLLEMSENGKK